MFTWSQIGAGAVLPGCVVAALLVVGWRAAHGRVSAREARSWCGPVAVAGGFMAGYAAILGWPGFPPLEASDWLFYLAPGLALAGLAVCRWRLGLAARAALMALAVGSAFVMLAWPLLRAEAPLAHDARMQVQIAAVVAVAALVSLDALAQRISAARLDAILLATAAPAALVLALSGSARFGAIGGLLAAMAAGGLAANLLLGPAAVGRGVVLVFGTLMAGLLLCAHLYAELSAGNALWLAAAPSLAWAAGWLPARLGWLATTAVQLAAVFGAGGVAVARAWLRFIEDAS